MTTSAVPTADDLGSDLDSAREQVLAAERELGSAALEGKGVERRSDALDQAQAEVRRLELAIDEAERRETEAEAEAASEARRQERISLYRSIVDWLPRVEAYNAARVALTEAEADLENNPPHGVISQLKNFMMTWADRRVADLDERLVESLPKPPRKGHTGSMPDPAKFTPERIAEITARATELLKAEERGESIAVTPGEVRERAARRRRIAVKERH
jgi:hypothetical protein